MPFVGALRGETVVPEEVDERVECIECGEAMSIVDRHERDGSFVARHFRHVGDLDGCSGGESDRHRRMKAIALSKVKHIYSCRAAGLERKFGESVADVWALFDEPHDRLGRGVVVEVQYRNDGKDVDAVTQNYLNAGLSVYWVESCDFENKDVRLINPIYWIYGNGDYGNKFDSDLFSVYLGYKQYLKDSDGGSPNYAELERRSGLKLDKVIPAWDRIKNDYKFHKITKSGYYPELSEDEVSFLASLMNPLTWHKHK